MHADDPPAVRRALAEAYSKLELSAHPVLVEGDGATAAVLLAPRPQPAARAAPGDDDPLAEELGAVALAVARATFAAAPAIERVLVLIAQDPGGMALPRPLAYGSLGRGLALREPPPPALEVLDALLADGSLYRRATTTSEALPTELPPRSDLRAALAVTALRPRQAPA